MTKYLFLLYIGWKYDLCLMFEKKDITNYFKTFHFIFNLITSSLHPPRV